MVLGARSGMVWGKKREVSSVGPGAKGSLEEVVGRTARLGLGEEKKRKGKERKKKRKWASCNSTHA